MKRAWVVAFLLLLFVAAALSFAAEKNKLVLKVGDERYVCNCGEKCPCLTISNNQGNCTCGTEMVKAKVIKVEKENVIFKADNWQKEKAYKTVGKYACDCSPDCKCGTISQNPGKCTCGSELKKM